MLTSISSRHGSFLQCWAALHVLLLFPGFESAVFVALPVVAGMKLVREATEASEARKEKDKEGGECDRMPGFFLSPCAVP